MTDPKGKKESTDEPASGAFGKTVSEAESFKLTTGRSLSSAAFGSKKYLQFNRTNVKLKTELMMPNKNT
jgi:hypothetical protein